MSLGATPTTFALVAPATVAHLIDAIAAGQASKPKFNGNVVKERVKIHTQADPLLKSRLQQTHVWDDTKQRKELYMKLEDDPKPESEQK